MTTASDDAVAALTWRAVLESARDHRGAVSVRDLIRVCETVITHAGLSAFNSMGSPRKDARALVFETLAIRDHADSYLDASVTAVERERILGLLEQRVSGPTPVPYLTGDAFFAGHRFSIRPGVFVPRSAIGLMLDELITAFDWPPTPRLLEIGCGTGAIGISFATRMPGAFVDLLDVDELAVDVTRSNIVRHGLRGRARAFASDMFGAVDPNARYDLIVANLPYVSPQHAGTREIVEEPARAIFGPGDGLDLVRVAIEEAHLYLADTGTLLLEVGPDNIAAVSELLGGRGSWWPLRGRDAGVVSITRDQLKA